MTDHTANRDTLMQAIDWSRPELQLLLAEADPLAAFVNRLRTTSRGGTFVELARKEAVVAYAREHYAGFREFDTSPATDIAERTLERARKPRALRDLPVLGRAWWATGDAKWGAAFERFYLETTVGELFNWGNFQGTQPAYELAAWLLLRDCPSFTVDGQIAYWAHTCTLAETAWNSHTSQWGHDMLGPEGHNWYLHGTQGLAVLGLLFPEFRQAGFYARTTFSVLEEHLRGHYRADGGARETNLAYQCGSIAITWELYLLAQRNHWSLPASFAETLLRATHFLLLQMTPDGAPASVGDGHHHPGAFCRLGALGAAIAGDPMCKWFAERCRAFAPDADTEDPAVVPASVFWTVGLEGAATYAQVQPKPPRTTSILLGATGYAALRRDWQVDSPYLHIAAADRGPIVTSHGHNDIFALQVHADGTRFLCTPGSAPYGKSAGRQYDQLSAAHNCLTLDGQEQVDLVDQWRWSQTVIPCVRRWITEPSHDFFHGVHEGFYRPPHQRVLHARKVLYLKGEPGYWLVFDSLLTDEARDVSIWWHGAVHGRIDGSDIRLSGDRSDLVIRPPADDVLALESYTDPDREAYLADVKANAVDHPCFRYRAHSESTCFVWLIANIPTGGAAPTIRRLPLQINGHDAPAAAGTALQVIHGQQEDTLIVSHRDWDADLTSGPLTTWGHLLLHRRGQVNLHHTHTMSDGIVGR